MGLFNKRKKDEENKKAMSEIVISKTTIDKLKARTFKSVVVEILVDGKIYVTDGYRAKVIGANNILSPSEHVLDVIKNSQWIKTKHIGNGAEAYIQVSKISAFTLLETNDSHTAMDVLAEKKNIKAK